MSEEFYCVLKLVSGEEIFSLVVIDENDGDTLIVLQNPVTIKITKNTVVSVEPKILPKNKSVKIINVEIRVILFILKSSTFEFLNEL